MANIESLLAKENESWKAVWTQVEQVGKVIADSSADAGATAVEPVVADKAVVDDNTGNSGVAPKVRDVAKKENTQTGGGDTRLSTKSGA